MDMISAVAAKGRPKARAWDLIPLVLPDIIEFGLSLVPAPWLNKEFSIPRLYQRWRSLFLFQRLSYAAKITIRHAA